MDGSLALPAGTESYPVSDLEQFLATADARRQTIEAAITAARARRDAARRATLSVTDISRDVADAWIAAQVEADEICARANADARAIIQAAEAARAGMR